MVLVFTSTVFAEGMIYDYREFEPPLADGTIIEKPLANFAIDVQSPSGEIKTSVATEHNNGATLGPAPSIKAQVGDTLVFTDRSSSQSGYKITAWDWQWWREDQPTEEHNLKSQMDRQLLLEVPGRYHFYLCVADNAPVEKGDSWLWSLNWSDNGKHRAIKNLGNGLQGYWYFNEIVVEVAEGAPDFYPTPEGSTQWQESFKTWMVTVPLPQEGQPNKLVFKCNIDGKTPGNEPDLNNNVMVIQFEPKGVDLAVKIMGSSRTVTMQTGGTMSFPIDVVVKRKPVGNDDLANVVTGDLTITYPGGTQKHLVPNMMPDYNQKFPIHFMIDKAGTYTVTAEIWPVGEYEIYPPDNTDEITIKVIETAEPFIPPLNDEIKTGLTG